MKPFEETYQAIVGDLVRVSHTVHSFACLFPKPLRARLGEVKLSVLGGMGLGIGNLYVCVLLLGLR